MADLDATLMQEALHVAKRQRETNVERHCQVDDVWARLEVAERWVLSHKVMLAESPDRLKVSSSDNAIGCGH